MKTSEHWLAILIALMALGYVTSQVVLIAGGPIAANDDLGLSEVKMFAQVNQSDEKIMIQSWPNDQTKPRRRALIEFKKTIGELGLRGGDQMQYWAAVIDRNPAGPGSAQLPAGDELGDA